MRPDFSAVRSKAEAERLVARGALVRVPLFPTELGGPDDPDNIAYITPEAADARALIVGTLMRFTRQGLVDQLTVSPDYKGDSIVPSRIRIKAWHSGKGAKSGGAKGGSFEPSIEVW